jgi:peptidoglycan biosynthesis protein MviN/MurJ (putative lipid II flippase)
LAGNLNLMVWATLAGTCLQLIILAALSSRHSASLRFSSEAWLPFWRAFGIMLVSQAVMALTTLVDQFFAAGLGEGAISALGYTSRVLVLFNGIVATAVARATLPVFSNASAAGQEDTRRVARRWAIVLALVGIFAVLVGWLSATTLVRIAFQRGTFTADDTVQVAALFRIALLQLPFYFASLVYVSLHSARGDYWILVASSVIGLLVKTLAVLSLIKTMGVTGLVLATAIMYAVNAVWLTLARGRRKTAVAAEM